MDVTGSFNAAAGQSASEGGQSQAGSSRGSSGPTASHADVPQATTHDAANAPQSDQSTLVREHAAQTTSQSDAQDNGVSKAKPAPRPSAINALQDRHFDELGSYYTESYHARERRAAEFDRRFGPRESELRAEIDQRNNILANSGPARLLWLKVSKQIPWDAREDLEVKRLELEDIEWRKEAERRATEEEFTQRKQALQERQQQEREALTGIRASPKSRPGFSEASGQEAKAAQSSSTGGPGRLTVEQATERLEFLEEQRAKPGLQYDHPAPESVAENVNRRTEENLATEISKLKMFLASAQQDPADADPDQGQDLS